MSEKNSKLTRREFLFGSAMAAAGVALSACAGPPPAAAPPTSAPATVSRQEPTSIPTQSATATPIPTITVQAREAPQLADLVKAGKLPPVADRLPKSPLVLSPVDGIGEYGGTLRTLEHYLGFWLEAMYGHSPLRWIDDGLGIAPGMCDWWDTNEDNSEWTVHIREGLKWSDGTPCTVDDVLFWWNDLVLDERHSDQPPDFGSAGGKLVEFIKIDDYTLKLKYAVPAPLTAARLAMWVKASIGPRWIAPKHYLQQFHPTYNKDVKSLEEFDRKIRFGENPDCPTLTAWQVDKYEASVRRVWKRNPYYYAVDTAGNQLPYIDVVDEAHIEDAEVQKLTIMQGGIDFLSHLHKCSLADLSTLKDNEEKGGYEVRLWDGGGGTGESYFPNYDHPDDKKRALYRNPKFKRAMSHAIDRRMIQKIVYYNTGEPTTGTYSPKSIEFNFNEEAKEMYRKARDCYVEYNLDKAKALLDEIGLKDVNGDGWREYPDGAKLEVRIDLQADAGKDCLNILEITSKAWRSIGLNIVVNQIPPSEFDPMWRGGQGEIHANWGIGDGPDHLVYPSWLVPNEPDRWAPLCGNRLMLVGTEQEDTELDKSPWERKPPRWASTEAGLRDGPVWKLQEIYQQAILEPNTINRHHMVWDMINIHINEGPFLMATVANQPRLIFVSKKLMNVPTREQLKTGGFCDPWIVPHPAITNPETYAFKKV